LAAEQREAENQASKDRQNEKISIRPTLDAQEKKFLKRSQPPQNHNKTALLLIFGRQLVLRLPCPR